MNREGLYKEIKKDLSKLDDSFILLQSFERVILDKAINVLDLEEYVKNDHLDEIHIFNSEKEYR